MENNIEEVMGDNEIRVIRNTTIYDFDLALRYNLRFVRNSRIASYIYSALSLLFSAVLCIVGAVSSAIYWVIIAVAFLPIDTILIINNSKPAYARRVRKSLVNNPVVEMNYEFYDTYFNIEVKGSTYTVSERVNYSQIKKIVKIDEKSCYLHLTKNLAYVIQDEEKFDEIFDFLKNAMPNIPVKE